MLAGAGLLAASPLQAQAEGTGFYVGFGLGQAEAKKFCDISGVPGATVGSCEDSDTAWRFFGGYQLNRYVGVELGYAGGPEFNASVTYLGLPATVKAEASALDVVAVGYIPLGDRFALFGKLGLYRWDLDVEVPGYGALSDSGTDLTYGLGVQFNFARKFAVRVEGQLYNDVGLESTTGTDDVTTYSASVVYSF